MSTAGGGPYYIMFGDGLGDQKYIAVDHTQSSRPLKGTEDVNEAEGFMVEVLDDSNPGTHLEFSLTSSFPMYRKKLEEEETNSDDKTSTESSAGGVRSKTHPLDYYLETHVNSFGRGSVLRMQMNSKLKNIRLQLKQRKNPRITCDTKQWRKGREAYYIQCVHWPCNGYLCVKEIGGTDRQKEYRVCIRPSVESDKGDGRRVFMLFQLKSI